MQHNADKKIMTNKKNYFFVAVVALVVGYVVGDLVRFPSVDENKVSGDISKVDLYSNQMEDPELALAVEQLQNDTAETDDG